MRKKLISKTYLRDVDKYRLDIYIDNDDFYLAVKKIIHTDPPFIVSSGECLIDDNYYLVEVIPKNENYTMRVYFNDKKERLEYYFDVSLENGIDEETKIPFYDDLYLDVTYNKGTIKVLDEDELQEALDSGSITKKEFALANKTKDMLVKSLETNTNKYMKLDLEKYLK